MTQTFKPNDPRPTCSETLGSFSANLRYEALSAAAVERVKHFVTDYLAIALRASTLDSSQPVRALARAYPIPGKATLLGRLDPVNPYWAALANGQSAHSMELDDAFLGPLSHGGRNGRSEIMKCDPQSSSLVKSLAEFVHATGFGDLPDTIRRFARQHFLDTIGCCVAAARLETSRSLASYLVSEGGVGQATGISVRQRLPA